MLENLNNNYACCVIRVNHVTPLENMDNCVGVSYAGYQAIVGKDIEIGSLGLFFVPDSIISREFLRENNLFRDSEQNKDKTKTGFFENSGRVKSLKLRGNVSTGFFIPLSAADYLNVELNEGDQFTHINSKMLCDKWVLKENRGPKNRQKGTSKKYYIDQNVFKEHIETVHFLRNLSKFKPHNYIIVTEKIHSVSARFAHLQVERRLKWWERLLSKFVKIDNKEWKYIAGSRRTIKLGQPGFYEDDIWTKELEKIKYSIPKNVVIYGEIVGWDRNKKLQHNYSYRIPQGETRMYVYRIAMVNEGGFMVDLSWKQVKLFCEQNNILHVPEIYKGRFDQFDYTKYENKKFVEDLGLNQCLMLDDEAPCSEGLVIRHDNGYTPYFCKYKSPNFYIHEGADPDAGRDLESVECCIDTTN